MNDNDDTRYDNHDDDDHYCYACGAIVLPAASMPSWQMMVSRTAAKFPSREFSTVGESDAVRRSSIGYSSLIRTYGELFFV